MTELLSTATTGKTAEAASSVSKRPAAVETESTSRLTRGTKMSISTLIHEAAHQATEATASVLASSYSRSSTPVKEGKFERLPSIADMMELKTCLNPMARSTSSLLASPFSAPPAMGCSASHQAHQAALLKPSYSGHMGYPPMGPIPNTVSAFASLASYCGGFVPGGARIAPSVLPQSLSLPNLRPPPMPRAPMKRSSVHDEEDSELEQDKSHANMKYSHKLAERKRRKEMNETFDELKALLPLKGSSYSKWEILMAASQHIESLKKVRAKLLVEKETLHRDLGLPVAELVKQA